MTSKPYTHKEAFCLMWYKCRHCETLVRIWNSRDGVTPFLIGCNSCGREMNHEYFGSDLCQPEHKLPDRALYFRDLRWDEALQLHHIALRRMQAHESYNEQWVIDRLRAAIADPDSIFRTGAPIVDVHRNVLPEIPRELRGAPH